jgi:hypothetical protein
MKEREKLGTLKKSFQISKKIILNLEKEEKIM